MHATVNDRLREQQQFLFAQGMQFRMLLGVLVHKMGDKVTVAQADLEAMKEAKLVFVTTAQPPKLDAEGKPTPDELLLEVITEEQAKERQAAAPRIEAPKPSLIIAP